MLSYSSSQYQELRIIIGAGSQTYDGWIATQREDLDLLDPTTWERSLRSESVDAFLCEHVWEHLAEEEGRAAAKLCYQYLKPGGYVRCAVPDGNFRNAEYQEIVQVGGNGDPDSPAADHKILYTHTLLTEVFEDAGFQVRALEYCTDEGIFHAFPWSAGDGPIYRSLATDHRNQAGTVQFASIIIDAIKPLLTAVPDQHYRISGYAERVSPPTPSGTRGSSRACSH